METIQYLQSHGLYFWIYVLFCFGMLFEGLFFALIVVFLVYSGIADPLPAFFSILIGIFLEQIIFYHFGTRLSNFPKICSWADKLAGRFDRHITEQTVRTVVISKFIYGLHRAILVRAGMLGVPYGRYMQASVIAAAFWIFVVGVFAYFFNASLSRFVGNHTIGLFGVLPFLLILVFTLLEKFLGKYLRRWL